MRHTLQILRYLEGTAWLAVRYSKSSDGTLFGYSDADWAGDCDDRHSTSGNLFMMAKGPISWMSKKQPVIALSMSEAEYIAVSMAAQEAVWLRSRFENSSQRTNNHNGRLSRCNGTC